MKLAENTELKIDKDNDRLKAGDAGNQHLLGYIDNFLAYILYFTAGATSTYVIYKTFLPFAHGMPNCGTAGHTT